MEGHGAPPISRCYKLLTPVKAMYFRPFIGVTHIYNSTWEYDRLERPTFPIDPVHPSSKKQRRKLRSQQSRLTFNLRCRLSFIEAFSTHKIWVSNRKMPVPLFWFSQVFCTQSHGGGWFSRWCSGFAIGSYIFRCPPFMFQDVNPLNPIVSLS